MDLQARPLRAFILVAEQLSFTRAAKRLHISQPALSAQIRELERLLGFSLFHREGRSIALTAKGAQLLDKARRLVAETDWFNQAAREIFETRLRIGAAHFTAAIIERRAIIDRLADVEPPIGYRVIGRHHAQLIEDLQRGEIDCAITLEVSDADHSLFEPVDEAIERVVLAERPIRIAFPAGPVAATGGELCGLPVATLNRSHGVALSETVARRLTQAGALVVHPPEGDAEALLRYAVQRQTAAVDLGWFGLWSGIGHHIALPGGPICSRLILLYPRGQTSPEIELLLAGTPASATNP